MPTIEKRLAALERDRQERYDAWLQTLTLEEIEAEIEQQRQVDPEGMALAEAMTLEELEAVMAGRVGHVKH